MLARSLVLDAPTSVPVLPLFAALVASVASGMAQLQLRLGSHSVAFEWGETALIVQVALLAPVWVPIVTAFGFCVANLVGGRRQPLKVAYNTGSWYVSATAAVAVLSAVEGGAGLYSVRGVVGLAAATVSFAFVTRVMTAAVVSIAEKRPAIEVLRAGSGLATLICAGNFVAGITILALARWSPVSLALLPPTLLASHLAYRGTARARKDRDAWRGLAAATQPVVGDTEAAVLAVAADRAAALFDAHHIQVLMRRTESGNPEWVALGDKSNPGAVDCAEHFVEVGLQDSAASVTALRLCFTAPVSLSPEEQQSLQTFAHWLTGTLEQTRLITRKAYEAAHDALTGLANRSTLLAHGESVIASSNPTDVLALLLVDLDHFKEVNDTLGHGAGDILLRIVAKRLAQCADGRAVVARLGGDEFAILISGLSDAEEAILEAHRYAAALSAFAEVDSYRLAVEGSVGVACYPADAGSVSELLRRADVALYQAKSTPIGVARYDQRLDGTSVDRLSLLPDLKAALNDGDIHLHFQPKYDLQSGRPIGAEALARWCHPEQGTLPPNVWVPAVEQSVLIRDFTAYVLERAIRACVTWPVETQSVAVNLSARSLLDDELPDLVASLLSAHGLAAESLVLEITETVMMSSLETVEQTLSRLRALGVKLSVDDFGTGYSSLTFLARQAVDEVKIDRSFIASMAQSDESAAIVRSVIDLARAFHLDVVAEGIETEEQEIVLRSLGCYLVQGFHYSKPVPGDQITELLLTPLADGSTVSAFPRQPTHELTYEPVPDEPWWYAAGAAVSS
jgi:diguanylate cyclase (GGDEF)-like protein